MNEQDEFFAKRHALREAAAVTGARVYIAGPMTGYFAYNWPAFAEAQRAWQALGWDARTPCEANDAVWQRHHGRDFDPLTDKCDYGDPILAEIYAEDQKLLATCSAIALLPGWEKSRGANHELAAARLLGLAEYDAATFLPMTFAASTVGQPVRDFAGEVDGGGYKASMDDPAKLPLWLVPSRFANKTYYHAEEYDGAGYAHIAEYISSWVNGESDNGLEYAVEELITLQGQADTLRGVAAVLQHGAKKYAAHNWRRGMKYSEVASAALRHVVAIIDAEEIDPESGKPHWAHLGCCLAFLLEYTEYPALYGAFDDRFKRPAASAA